MSTLTVGTIQNSSGNSPIGAGRMAVISTANGTSVSNITFDGIDTDVYRAFNFIGGAVPNSDNQEFNFYWRASNSDCVADTYFTGYNRLIPSDTADPEAEQYQGRLQLCGQTGNQDDEGFFFNIFMFPFRTGDENNMGNFITWQGMHRDGSGNFRTVQGAGNYLTNVAPDGFKFQPHSGTIDHYNYTLYGLKR